MSTPAQDAHAMQPSDIHMLAHSLYTIRHCNSKLRTSGDTNNPSARTHITPDETNVSVLRTGAHQLTDEHCMHHNLPGDADANRTNGVAARTHSPPATAWSISTRNSQAHSHRGWKMTCRRHGSSIALILSFEAIERGRLSGALRRCTSEGTGHTTRETTTQLHMKGNCHRSRTSDMQYIPAR